MASLAVIAWWVLDRTPAGRYIYAVGGNPEAAETHMLRYGCAGCHTNLHQDTGTKRAVFGRRLAERGVAREAIEHYGDESAAKPVGSGPFRLKSYTRSSKIVLERNPNFREEYYEAEPPAEPPQEPPAEPPAEPAVARALLTADGKTFVLDQSRAVVGRSRRVAFRSKGVRAPTRP